MLTWKTEKKPSALDKTIDAALADLEELSTNDPHYQQTLDRVKELYKLKENNTPKRVSPDTLAIVVGNLAGIVLILGYERANVVTTKALGFILKSK